MPITKRIIFQPGKEGSLEFRPGVREIHAHLLEPISPASREAFLSGESTEYAISPKITDIGPSTYVKVLTDLPKVEEKSFANLNRDGNFIFVTENSSYFYLEPKEINKIDVLVVPGYG